MNSNQSNQQEKLDHFVSCISDNTCGCVYCNKHAPIIVQALLGENQPSILPNKALAVAALRLPQNQLVQTASLPSPIYIAAVANQNHAAEPYVPANMPTTSTGVPYTKNHHYCDKGQISSDTSENPA